MFLLVLNSVSQLETYGKLNPGGKIAARFNGGIGAGHSEKVVTAGKKTKFAVNLNLFHSLRKSCKV